MPKQHAEVIMEKQLATAESAALTQQQKSQKKSKNKKKTAANGPGGSNTVATADIEESVGTITATELSAKLDKQLNISSKAQPVQNGHNHVDKSNNDSSDTPASQVQTAQQTNGKIKGNKPNNKKKALQEKQALTNCPTANADASKLQTKTAAQSATELAAKSGLSNGFNHQSPSKTEADCPPKEIELSSSCSVQKTERLEQEPSTNTTSNNTRTANESSSNASMPSCCSSENTKPTTTPALNEQQSSAPTDLPAAALPLSEPMDMNSVHIEYKQYESELQMHDIMRLIQAELSEPYSIYTYRYFIYNWPKLCFLAAHGNEYVGAIVCKLDMHKDVRRGYIAMLAVRKEYRKLKIGTNLVQKAIEAMLADNADEVVLETEMRNLPALRLYENLGFVRDKRLFRYYLNGVDALRLKLWFR